MLGMDIDFGKRLGMGCLRLPLLNPDDQESIDYKTLEKNVDLMLENGYRYFDTSFIYHNGQSEVALGKALVDRHPRESFLLSTKMPIKFMHCADDMERVFSEQLSKCHVDYFDFYLIHAISTEGYKKCKEWGVFEFLEKKKAEGKFREFGVSFHDTPEFLDTLLTEHPEINFVVAQLNYLDWVSPATRSKELYEICVKHNKPIVVMEAIKGGNLVNLPAEAKKLMRGYNPNASLASWALRFTGSLPGVRVTLAGMPSTEFCLDDMKTFNDFKPLNDEEYAIIDQVVDIIKKKVPIPCTYCRYCEPGCPKKIDIPDYFSMYNSMKMVEADSHNFVNTEANLYAHTLEKGRGAACECIRCGKCEKVCPQHLPIMTYLQQYIAGELEEGLPPDVKQAVKAKAFQPKAK